MIFKWLSGLPQTVGKSLFWTLLIIVSTSLLLFQNITHATNFKNVYRDTNFQLSAAINAHLCHTQHMLDPKMINIMRQSGQVTDSTHIFDIPRFNNMSMQAYCNQHIKDIPTTVSLEKNFDVAEGLPLYWVDRALIGAFGNVTMLQMNIMYRLLQIAFAAVFTFYLLTIGVRWPSVWVITLLANFVNTIAHIQAMNIHGFVLPCSLAIIAMYGIAMRFRFDRYLAWHSLWVVIISALELWLFYGRSSQLFALLAFNVIYVIFLLRKSDRKCCLVITFLLVKLITISLLCYAAWVELGPKALTRTHPVIHSVILGMGTPSNQLARQQGIKWEDMIGLDVAKRVNPKVDTLYSQEYNAALTTWYFSLWKNDTHSMLSLYNLKFYYLPQTIIKNIALYIKQNYTINLKPLFYPFTFIEGYVVLWLMLIGVFYYLFQFVSKLSNGCYVVLCWLILAFLNLLENALVSSVFAVRFQTIFIFSFLVWVYVFWGSVVYGCVLLWKKIRSKSIS